MRGIAAQIELTIETGASVRESLIIKADSLRQRRERETERHAAAQTSRMTVPMVAMAMTVVLFVVGAALSAISTDIDQTTTATTTQGGP